jgi:hypothetical protein
MQISSKFILIIFGFTAPFEPIEDPEDEDMVGDLLADRLQGVSANPLSE